MPSFSIALTGLEADSTALSTIGNNLANLNTTAFKEQTANFSDLFYANVGGSGSNAPLQVGIGTKVSSIDTDFAQGSLSTTSDTTDMALNGSGFFVVNDNGANELTRAGDFQLSPTGNLITSDGYTVQGYPATNGIVNTDAALATINIPTASTQLPHATQNFTTTTSLDSSAAVGTEFTSSSVMYDSLGAQHTVDVVFTKTGTSTWGYNVTMPAGDASTVSSNTGTLTFNSDGTLASPAGDVTGITFAGLSDSASDMTLNWNLHDSSGNSLVTQSAAASANNAITQDGYASGTYQSFAVDTSGVVTATFSNGGTQVLGQVAVATVANENGLSRDGNNIYSTNAASGTMNVGVANEGGRGALADSSLEQSNIDISTEFANLIVAQRAFEANSKTVTAFDTITQDTINLIR